MAKNNDLLLIGAMAIGGVFLYSITKAQAAAATGTTGANSTANNNSTASPANSISNGLNQISNLIGGGGGGSGGGNNSPQSANNSPSPSYG